MLFHRSDLPRISRMHEKGERVSAGAVNKHKGARRTLMRTPKTILAAAVMGCVFMAAATAMPADQLGTTGTTSVQNAAWICGPYRCWWRPGPPWWWRHHHHWW